MPTSKSKKAGEKSIKRSGELAHPRAGGYGKPKNALSREGRSVSGSSLGGGPPDLPHESIEETKRRVRKIIAILQKTYPDATCALHHASALQLLVATILSAQSTDVTVNKVTPVLFAKFPSVEALAAADAAEVEKIIYPTGFFRNKAKSVIGACKAIVDQHGGQVPGTMNELITLPGVARKTANVLLGTWFGRNDGVVVDTHVGRLAHRLGLTWTSKDEKDAVKIEQDLMRVIPQDEWTFTAHALVWHGRRVCTARKPNCAECPLNKLCPSAFKINGEPGAKARSAK